jgi:hypothetical protein
MEWKVWSGGHVLGMWSDKIVVGDKIDRYSVIIAGASEGINANKKERIKW